MKTENEIKMLPLEEQQKLVLDLKQVPAGDRYYETAQRLIKFIEGLKAYKQPETVEVKNIAGHVITVDGRVVEPDATTKVFPWQYNALARFLEKVGKSAALLLFLLLLSLTASAQSYNYAVGSSGNYSAVYVAGLNGGTNWINGTNTYNTPVTNTVITTNANWTIVNGLATNQVTYTTNSTVTQPAMVSMANFDLADIYLDFALTGSGTSVLTTTWDYSDDMVKWRNAALTILCTAAGTTEVSTNTTLSTFGPGFIRLNTASYASTSVFPTNLIIEVGRKTSKTGP